MGSAKHEGPSAPFGESLAPTGPARSMRCGHAQGTVCHRWDFHRGARAWRPRGSAQVCPADPEENDSGSEMRAVGTLSFPVGRPALHKEPEMCLAPRDPGLLTPACSRQEWPAPPDSYRSIFSRIVSDDTVAPRVPLGPFGNVVDLAVDDEPPVGAQVVLLNLFPAEGRHRSLALGAPLSLVTSLTHAACLPGCPVHYGSGRPRLAAPTVPLLAAVCGRRPPRFRLLSSTPPPTAPPPLAFAPPRLH